MEKQTNAKIIGSLSEEKKTAIKQKIAAFLKAGREERLNEWRQQILDASEGALTSKDFTKFSEVEGILTDAGFDLDTQDWDDIRNVEGHVNTDYLTHANVLALKKEFGIFEAAIFELESEVLESASKGA